MNKPNNILAKELAIVGGYVLLTIIFTYPLVLHLNDMIIGLAGDAESHMWSFWWMRKATLELHTTPYFTTWLYYPEGVSLYFYAYNVVHAILSIPLQSFMGLIATYNISEMLGFVAASYGAYLLTKDVTESRLAGFVAGIAYGFAPIQVFHFNLGQPNLHGVEFIPLYIWCIRRWLNDGHYRWLLGSAITLALNSYSDWQFAVYMQLFTGVAILAVLLATPLREWGKKLWNLGWRTTLVEILYTIAVAPVVVPMVMELLQPRPYMYRSRRDTIYHAPDLLAFFIPNPEHPLWRTWGRQLFDDLRTPGIVLAVVSLSYVALVLAVIAIIRNWKQTRFWFFAGLTFLILALGPQLRVMGHITDIPLPYEVLFQFKIIKVTRAPARYFVVTSLCLAVLAGMGMQALIHRLHRGDMETQREGKSRAWQGMLLPSIIISMLCFELLPAPVYVEPAAPSPAFLTDDTLKHAGGIMEWPDAGNRSMYYATVHTHPVMYGEMSRDNPPGPLLKYLRKGPFHEEIIDPAATWHCLVNAYHITHLLVYHDEKYMRPLKADERHQMLNEFVPTLPLIAQSPELSLYQLPQGDVNNTCLTMGKGWSKARAFGPDEPLYRWMGDMGTIGVYRQQAGRVTLHFHAHSFAFPRQATFSQSGEVVGELQVDQPKPFELELDLPAGLSWIDIQVDEPAVSPADYGYDELEPVSIALSQLWVESVGARD